MKNKSCNKNTHHDNFDNIHAKSYIPIPRKSLAKTR